MKKLNLSKTRFRRVSASAAVLALASFTAAGCDPATGPDAIGGPGAVTGVEVVVLPVGTSTTNLQRNITRQLLAAPHDANNLFVNTPVTWTTSDATRATVDANGLVTTVGGGDVVISATAGGVAGTFNLNIQFPVGTVTVGAPAGSIRQEGTVALSATITGTDGTPAIGRTVTWSSSNTAIATVNSSGVVSGVADGVATITATSEGVSSAGTPVTVAGLPLVASVTVTPGTPFRGVGQTVQMTQTSRAASGTTIAGTTATWTSSSAGVATVSPTGLVTIVGPGTTTIRATVPNGAGTNVEGSTVLTGASVLVNGVGTSVPTVSEDDFIDYAFVSDGTLASFTVVTSATASGDSDMHVFAPGVTPVFVPSQLTYSGFVCRPWNVGSGETCTINTPVAGTYRIRFYNYPGDGTLTGMTATLTHP